MENCPTCGRVVSSIFDHVDEDCENWDIEEADAATGEVKYKVTHTVGGRHIVEELVGSRWLRRSVWPTPEQARAAVKKLAKDNRP